MAKTIIMMVLITVATSIGMAQNPKEYHQISSETQNITLAVQLSSYGYANKSPLPLIQAAQIIKENNITPKTEEKEIEGVIAATDEKRGKVSLNAEQLLADAKILAAGDNTLIDLIDQVSEMEARGSVGGRTYDTDRVPGLGAIIYTVKFMENTYCEASCIGDGDTNLEIEVYNDKNELVTSGTSNDNRCYVSWRPSSTRKFKIKIINNGKVYNEMTFTHN